MSNDDFHPVVWMKCPYPEEICTEPMTWDFDTVSSIDDGVQGTGVCAAGHRWRVIKLPNLEVVDG